MQKFYIDIRYLCFAGLKSNFSLTLKEFIHLMKATVNMDFLMRVVHVCLLFQALP